MTIILAVLSALLAATAVALWINGRAQRSRITEMNQQQMREQEAIRTLTQQRTEAEMNVKALREKAESDRVELEKLQSSFRLEFKNLANEILEEKSRQFKESNKESLEGLLKPFKTNITEFRDRVEKIYSDENQQRGALKSEIKNLLDLNRSITQQTTNLTNALKGNSKVQGDWGEMILETILDSSHLIKGIHYNTQENLKDEEGKNLRPDVILNLPDNKQIVIDSKVSLTAFVGYTESEQPEERKRFLDEHVRSVRNHVTELGTKRYQSLIDSPDFVIMFVPNEPAFLSALQHDSDIWSEAYNKKVIVSSPTNLFALLKIVDDLWKRDTQSKHALAIADAGGALYDKFVGFADTLMEVGKQLTSAGVSYEKAVNQLKTGKGNLVSRAERLRELGVKAAKHLPVALTDYDDEKQ